MSLDGHITGEIRDVGPASVWQRVLEGAVIGLVFGGGLGLLYVIA